MRLTPGRTLAELADYANRVIRTRLGDVGGSELWPDLTIGGDSQTVIEAVCPVESITFGCLTFATRPSYLKKVEASEAAAVILPPGLAPGLKPFLRAMEPRLAFSVILELTVASPSLVPGDPVFKDPHRVEIGEDVVIGHGTYIGADVKIGRGSHIYPQVYIDDQVTIGEGCLIYPQVSIRRGTTLGRRVIIHAGAIIGDDGFGYNQIVDLEKGRIHHLKNVHAGGVIIEDHVEIGSQVCIDRGLAGNTVIGAGTKIDNLCQIAHNVQIGRDCIILAMTGISGSARLGDRVFLLGKVAIKDGVTVGDDAVIVALSGVMADLPAGRVWYSGKPAQKADQEWKKIALSRRELPRLPEFWKALKKSVSFEDLKRQLSWLKTSGEREEE